MNTPNFPEDHIDSPAPQPPPLINREGRTPGGARRPDLNPTGFVQPDVVSEYNQAIIEDVPSDQLGAHDGLRKDSATGHLIGIEQAPYASHPQVGAEYPKWITPNKSHVAMAPNAGAKRRETGDFDTDREINDRKEEHADDLKTENDNLIVPRGSVVSVPGFQHHVRRNDGALMVLVNDEEEEKRALGEEGDAKPDDKPSQAELRGAELAYDREIEAEKAKHRKERVAELVQERREAAIADEEKALDARRQQLHAGNEGPRLQSAPVRDDTYGNQGQK